MYGWGGALDLALEDKSFLFFREPEGSEGPQDAEREPAPQV